MKVDILIQHHDIDRFALDESPHPPRQRQLNANEPRQECGGCSQLTEAFQTCVENTSQTDGGFRRYRSRVLENDNRESEISKFLKSLARIGEIQSGDHLCCWVVHVKKKV